ncbi:GtrA family protein [Massilia sp. GCM10023247]|uniref:GtrA family protein n=1 Tax=Massilia sp. GCM10023247 TaxID=3252643 RepID=UPI00362061C3
MTALKLLLARHRALLVFGAIGVCNTLLHSLTVVALVENGIATPVPANVAGFLIANTFSFFSNSWLAFQQSPTWARYGKFALVSLTSLVLTVCLSGLAEAMDWHYLAGLGLVMLCGPVLTYLLHKAFTFRPPELRD